MLLGAHDSLRQHHIHAATALACISWHASTQLAKHRQAGRQAEVWFLQQAQGCVDRSPPGVLPAFDVVPSSRPGDALKLVRSTLELEGVPPSALGGADATRPAGEAQAGAHYTGRSPFVQPLLQLAARCEEQLKNG
jgi:hypothetical protein